MARIKFSTWGPAARRFELPAYAQQRPDEEPKEAVWRAIQRATRCAICAGPAHDGTEMGPDGRATANVYHLALGHPARTGGYNVEGEMWVKIPTTVY